MGGGRKFHYPKYVWSPAGGWWNQPTAWQRNTAVAFGAIALLNLAVFNLSRQLERRPVAPHKHIPSQLWCTHAEEDDPSLAKGWGSR
ncbi:hypothetical protein JKP88DRAFT_322411 [Tribonema minus]|uniref:Uncharacterized protein n=1 Tax=Tribonema minus TaxID=303371 RepID=A0A835YUQ9_9STRA|nr:hypothetical protein JKP88DRAFT_351105 [Tribonema minus]KAG5178849.1 hypothetical protein JKP88DRAFT_350219 [Tribonema minus]KAG5179469.1 hypothetical protein JKP88DRAFT_354734 [Tribonema minus]KAG5181063.1 hypothetical protein JKP88DRAFT_322411 [Tribonema minus]